MARIALACLIAMLAYAPAYGAEITIGPDGKTAPVFDYNTAVRERVFIPQPGIDQDGDGANDRIGLEIIRPVADAGEKLPAIIDPSPYYTTVCRGNEGQCIGDVNGDGINDRWPLFYGKYFVPRGDAYILAESNGTGNSTGCPLHGGPGDIAGQKSVIDWLNGRATAVNAAGDPVVASWHNGSAAMIGKSYDGTLANGVAATGVEGLETIVPISAISSWYAYSRMGGIRFNTNYPASLSNTVTNPDRRLLCAPSRLAMSDQDGDDTGDLNAFWNARNYLTGAADVTAAVFATHGLQDDNVKMDHLGDWWTALGEAGVPRKLWLLREGHVDPFESRRAVWVDTLHRWFDHWLLDVDNGVMDEPAVYIEDAKDTWSTHDTWPIPGTQATDVFLRGITPDGVGGLGLSTGGALDSVGFRNQSITETALMNDPTGAQVTRRVFLSEPLTAPLRISGTPRVDVRMRFDTTQSNLGAALIDYGPSTQITRSGEGVTNTADRTCWGQTPTDPNDFSECYLEVTKPTVAVAQWRVSRGILDSANRNSLTTPEPVTIGADTAFSWPLMPQDHTFPAGHQIGVVLVGNYSGYSGQALGVGTNFTLDTRLSKLTLPVVGGYPAAVAAGAFAPDTVAPTIAVSDDVAVTTNDPGGRTVDYAAASAADNEDPAPSVSCAPASGTVFPIGDTTVTCTAADASGNETTGTFTVRVALEQGPPNGGDPSPTSVPTPPAPDGTGDTPVPPSPQPGPSDAEPDPLPPGLDTSGDRVRPKLRGLRVRRAGKRVRIRVRVSEQARLTIRIRRGKKVVTVKTRRVRVGANRIVLRGKALRRARLVVRVRAVDGAGNKSKVKRRAVRVRRR